MRRERQNRDGSRRGGVSRLTSRHGTAALLGLLLLPVYRCENRGPRSPREHPGPQQGWLVLEPRLPMLSAGHLSPWRRQGLPEPGSTSHLRALQAISAASMPATPPDLASPHLWSNSCAVEHTQALGPERKQAGLIGNHASPCPPAASVLALTLSCHLQNPMSGVSWEAP